MGEAGLVETPGLAKAPPAAKAGRALAVWLTWPRKEYVQRGPSGGPRGSPNEAWGQTPLAPQLPGGLF